MNIKATISSFIKFCRKTGATTMLCENLSIPKGARYRGKKVLIPKDLKTLFSSDTTIHRGKLVKDSLINAYRLQVVSGLRPGELLGLKWDDVTPTTIYIKRSRNKYNDITDGKNENAIRAIGMNDYMMDILESQKRCGNNSEFIFDVSQKAYRDAFKRFCEANNMQYVTPYELRHTFVSIVKQLPIGDVKEIVGHSKNMDTFGIYGHEMAGDRERVSKEVSELFKSVL